MMLAPPVERMKADFFIELQRIRGPALEDPIDAWMAQGDSKSVELLLDKYLNGTIRSVTEFRQLAEVYRASERLGKTKTFNRRFAKFLIDPEMTIDAVEVTERHVFVR